jgi:hypothetical protein
MSPPCDMTIPAKLDAGGATLYRSGSAVRSTMLGLVDLYAIALYVPLQSAGQSLTSRELPKVFWIGICYDDSLPRLVPRSWRRELVPRLGSIERRTLRAHFAALNQGEIMKIAYEPGSGTTIQIGRGAAIDTRGHALMVGLLDHWIGQTPVSVEIKEALAPAPTIVPTGRSARE